MNRYRTRDRGGSAGGGAPALHYYVSSAGNDSNDGLSPGAPWLTVGKVNGETFNPGDTISFNGGDTFSGTTLTVPSSGLSGAPITFNSYGTGQATITPASGGNGIYAENKSYITIDNLNLTGGGGATGAGIYLLTQAVNTTYGQRVLNCNISGFAGSGIWVRAQSGGETNDPYIYNCTAQGCTIAETTQRTAGIMFQGASDQSASLYTIRNPIISYCSAKNNTGVGGAVSWTGSGIYLGQSLNGTVEYCYANANGALSSGPTGIWTSNSRGTHIYRCESANTTSSGSDGGGFDIDGGCDNCTIEYCYSHDNYGYGFLCFEFDNADFTSNHDNVIRYNVSVNDGLANPSSGASGGGGIRMQSSGLANSGECYNNTIILTSTNATGIELDKATADLTWLVANNIIYRRAGTNPPYIQTSAANPAACTVVGNNYFGNATFKVIWASSTYSTLATWQAATGQEEIGGSSVATEADPVFIGAGPPQMGTSYNPFMDSYILDNSSTLLGAAVNLSSNYGVDQGEDWFGNTSAGYTAGIANRASAVSQVIYTASATTTVPADFVSIYKAECIGAGGSTLAATARAGCGGGAYSAGAPTLTASAALQVVIGAAASDADGGDTVFNASSLANAVSNGPTVSVGAQGGRKATGAAAPGAGGLASAGVGGIATYDGGTGGATGGRSGGGGAASGAGAGKNGGTNGGNSTCGGGGGQGGGGNGGNGAAGTGGRGGSGLQGLGPTGGGTNGTNGSLGTGGSGAGTSGTGGRGSDAFEWIVPGVGTYGPGGGGGGCYTGTSNRGGTYGGGAGGQAATGGGVLGAAGVARLLYHTSANV